MASTMSIKMMRPTIFNPKFISTGISYRKLSNVPQSSIYVKDQIWQMLRRQGEEIVQREPAIAPLIDEAILNHNSFKDALIYRLATKLSGNLLRASFWSSAMSEAMEASLSTDEATDIERLAMEDLIAVESRDPACNSICQAFLYFKGYKAIQCSRFAHMFWRSNRNDLALVMQARISEVFGVDIHPNASLGGGLMFDHATGIVIGETAVIGRNCSLLHGVTLGAGATGRHGGDRHPKIGDHCVIGCQSTILGNIQIGGYCKIGSASMVLKPLQAGSTAVGNPLRILNVDENILRILSPAGGKSDKLETGTGTGKAEDEDTTQSPSAIITWTNKWEPKWKPSSSHALKSSAM